MKAAITLIVLAVIIGGIIYIKKDKNIKETEVASQEVVSQPVQGENTGKKIPFSKFATQEGSYKCDVNQYVDDQEYKGVVYVNNGKIRGDYNITQPGLSMKISFIAKDGLSYTWTDKMPTGFISRMRIDEDTKAEGNPSGSYSWNIEQVGDYNCEPYQTTDSQFSVPSNITFTEIKGKAVLN